MRVKENCIATDTVHALKTTPVGEENNKPRAAEINLRRPNVTKNIATRPNSVIVAEGGTAVAYHTIQYKEVHQ